MKNSMKKIILALSLISLVACQTTPETKIDSPTNTTPPTTTTPDSNLLAPSKILAPSRLSGKILLPSQILLPSGILLASGATLSSSILLPSQFRISQDVTTTTTTSESTPVPIFEVEIFDMNQKSLGKTRTNDKSEYTFKDIPVKERHRIDAFPVGASNMVLKAWVELEEEQSDKDVELDVNATTTSMAMLLEYAADQKMSFVKEMTLKEMKANPVIQKWVKTMSEQMVKTMSSEMDQPLMEMPDISSLGADAMKEMASLNQSSEKQ